MDFAIDDDFVALAAVIREFFERRSDASTASRGRWAELCGIGLPALRVPEPAGIGASLLDSTAVAETLGAALLPEPAAAAIVLAHAMTGQGAQEDVMAAVLDGSRIFSLAPQVVTSEPDGTLSGRVRILDQDVADVVAVRVCGSRSGLALLSRSEFVVATDHSDVDPERPTALCDVTGTRPMHTMPMAPAEAAAVIRDWAVLTVAELVGEMQAVLAATVVFTKERKQFGRSIGGFQAIKHQLADMYIAAEQARAAVQFAAIGCDRASATAATDVAAAARWVPRAAIQLFDTAIHLHGAMGYSWELGVHQHLRRAAATRTLLRESRVTEPHALYSGPGLAS